MSARIGDTTPALHNSGPGPRTVHRTAAVGHVWRLDLGAVLRDWPGLPAALRHAFPPPDHDEDDVPPPLRGTPAPIPVAPRGVVALSTLLVELLTPDELPLDPGNTRLRLERALAAARGDEARARAALGALTERVRQLGALVPLHGLARWSDDTLRPPSAEERAAELPWLPRGPYGNTLRVAWLACAVSHFSPPLILWTRPPSLTWWRMEGYITLRWFGGRASTRPDGGAR